MHDNRKGNHGSFRNRGSAEEKETLHRAQRERGKGKKLECKCKTGNVKIIISEGKEKMEMSVYKS